MFAGGIADKLGNRYEAKWLVLQLLDVVGGKAQSVRFEGISANFNGFEFAVRRGGLLEWHQTKISNPNGNWTLGALQREGVLAAFKGHLSAGNDDVCVFVSQDPAKQIGVLAQKARIASTANEYREALGDGYAEKFTELQGLWAVSPEITFSWLKRCEFRTESQLAIESVISTYSDFYFFKHEEKTFAVLRDFLETRINQLITTESARRDIRSEGKLTFKDWSIDPTLQERLQNETAAYLETYIPFGAGGATIPRLETSKLLDRIKDAPDVSVILLTGVAGAGKSGVIREFVGQLTKRNIPHLAVRIDHYLGCTSPKTLGKAITDRDESPIATLKGLSPDQVAVMVVDQVDAVSEVSGRNGIVKQAVLRLVDDVRNFGRIVLVIACRTFDLESDERLKSLKDGLGVEHIDVQLLRWSDDVKPLLTSKAVDIEQFTEGQKELLRLPLNLSIFLETFDGAASTFGSRNDLFARLLEKKNRSVRNDRSVAWDILAPLSKLAEWMSERQRLDAPDEVISEFGGALDILFSEGLIVRSRGQVNFFHESFFDYVYARTFSSRKQPLVSLLLESEQHLFRRTQVRQILETLRQIDRSRYLHELEGVIHSDSVRYHIKVAVAQWLGSLPDPWEEEWRIAVSLDSAGAPFPALARYALFNSPGWFDILHEHGWIAAELDGVIPSRTESILWWLSNIAGQRPSGIAGILRKWWDGRNDRGQRLLDWFGVVKRQKPDAALIDLCRDVIRSDPPGLFAGKHSSRRDLLLHTWAGENPIGAAEVLSAYFDTWFKAHPNQHPFESDEFRDLDAHSLEEMANKSPEAFIEGSILTFVRSIDLIVKKEAGGKWDYSFKHRSYSGHHFGADKFLSIFRKALLRIAEEKPLLARQYLLKLDPQKHEVFAHVWLETIAINGREFSDLIIAVLNSPYLFEAGWEGADWKSFADAAREAIPYLSAADIGLVEEKILGHMPELEYAARMAKKSEPRDRNEERSNWRLALLYLNDSGRKQWCILQGIGQNRLSGVAQSKLQQLGRKFREDRIPEPHHNEAHWVQSPIERDKAVHLTDAQWLNAIERYSGEDDRRRTRTFTTGGAHQLAGEIQHLTKEQPRRFAELLDRIPDDAHQSYVGHILWGLAEAGEVDDSDICRAIISAHRRLDRPYGSDIARLIQRQPGVAAVPAIFEILCWYVEFGEANDDVLVDTANVEREIASIEDLISGDDGLYIRGINSARGAAAEALGSALWEVPALMGKAWSLLERRAVEETQLSVRCCLVRPAVPLFNDDRERCAALLDRLSRPPLDHIQKSPTLLERTWLGLAFPSDRLPKYARSTAVHLGERLEHFAQSKHRAVGEEEALKWWSPLITHHGINLVPFVLNSVPIHGKRLIYRLVVSGDEKSRMIGAWQVFRRSFHDPLYAPLADKLADSGVVYRRLLADIASSVVTRDEYRYRAEDILGRSFSDDDRQVRNQAADVFRNIKPDEFLLYKGIAWKYLNSRAFDTDGWAFFHALDEATCKVDDIVISATEKLMADIKENGTSGGRRSMDLHQLQDIIKREYVSSETEPDLRRRFLDLIDGMLSLELYGADTIVKAHER